MKLVTEKETVSRGSTRGVLIFVAFIFCLGAGAMLTWGLVSVWKGPSSPGDGVNPDSYGFDLSNLELDREAIQTSGNRRDFLEAYVSPAFVAGANVVGMNASRSRSWQKEVVSDDRVIGVEIGGESRAYPLFIMNAHEVVLDELGGVPIAVTYSPLVDAVSVFDRRVGSEVLDFGVSGLLADGNTLYYDVGETPSLFSQLQGKAISGPRAGQALKRIPGVAIDRWAKWRASHPDTTVILREPGTLARYKRISYDRYFKGSSWLIPPRVTPLEGAKDRVLAVKPVDEEGWLVLDLAELRTKARDDGMVDQAIGDRRLRLRFDSEDPRVDTVEVISAEGLELVPSLRIAWPEAAEPGPS